jgi:NAD(P)H-dependent flavin oxidoreductase YrpB (nitropropane dioxygenase family)
MAPRCVGCAQTSKVASGNWLRIFVDVIVAQGMESGGHVRGQVGRLPLLPTVVEAVAPTPVLAAGGIVHGRGLAAALSLGAEGVWVGPRFVASAESEAHEDTIRGLPARLA